MTDPTTFILANTELLAPPLVPELRLHLASEIMPLWHKTEEELEAAGVPPPFWAFAWAGGQALARYVLDHREIVRGKRVLDFGAGSGLVGIAAMKADGVSVLSTDIDKFAVVAISLNAQANDVAVTATWDDVIGRDDNWDVILAGDVCYEQPLASRAIGWLSARANAGATVLIGDPGRSYFPKNGLERLETYRVQTTRELEDSEIRETSVYRLSA
jgi:predicted nicotinamide N-methyase